MLLALARPSRSVDLSRLDIQARSFTSSGLAFKPQHLSKQSRSSKPLADFFYPRFPEDPQVGPVVTLQAYEARTLEFRALKSDSPKTTLFLSWIGKHDPVTSCTIARSLKTCLQDAGIDTRILKAHSVRGQPVLKLLGQGLQCQIFYRQQTSPLNLPNRGFTIDYLRTATNSLSGKPYCPQLLQTYMLILRWSFPKCNFRMAQGM